MPEIKNLLCKTKPAIDQDMTSMQIILNSGLSAHLQPLIFSLCDALKFRVPDFVDSWLVATNQDSPRNDASGKGYPGTLDNERITVSGPNKELYIY